MENFSISEFVVRYIFIPCLTFFSSLALWVLKRQNADIDELINRTNKNEKDIAEIRQENKTEFKYISRDIKEIKELLKEVLKNHEQCR